MFKQMPTNKNDYNTNKNIAMLNLKQHNTRQLIKYASGAMQCDFDT